MRSVVFVAAVLLAAPAAAQVVYKWTDANGVVHYGDRAPRDANPETVAIEPPPPGAGFASAAPVVEATAALPRRASSRPARRSTS